MNNARINLGVIAIVILALLPCKCDADDCTDSPDQLEITNVDGAQDSSTQDYYVVQLPTDGSSVTVTITGKGSTQCPSDDQKCTCGDQSVDPTPGDLDYEFNSDQGVQFTTSDNQMTWTVDSSVAPGEYTFELQKVTQNYQDCSEGYSGGVSSIDNTQASTPVTILVCQVTTQTVATTPGDRTRTTLGIGEEVDCTFNPSMSVDWDCSGGGYLGGPGNSATQRFTAPNTASSGSTSSTITATVKGVALQVNMTTIEPTGVTGQKTAGTGGTLGSVDMSLTLTFQPTTVSFYNCEMKEVACSSTNATGYYAGPPIEHNPTADWNSIDPDNTVQDDAGFDDQPSPWSLGHFDWSIPYIVRVVGTSTTIYLPNVTESFDMLNAAGDCDVQKLNCQQP